MRSLGSSTYDAYSVAVAAATGEEEPGTRTTSSDTKDRIRGGGGEEWGANGNDLGIFLVEGVRN
jgi:hypothetical protein